jgi:uncharacterized protein (DUF2147 family)
MIRSILANLLALSSLSALAQMSPVGLWQTISDTDGKVTSEVRIVDAAGVLSGAVERALVQSGEPNCDQCTDDRKGKPKVGMQIIRDAKKVDGKDVWEGGNILDPNNGKIYKLRLTPVEGGKKLEVRGYIGTPMLGRTQTWVRVQ